MSLSTKTNTHISCVLHTSPGSDKARGHLGSSLQRKAKGEQLHNCTHAQGRVTCAVCVICASCAELCKLCNLCKLCRCVQVVQSVQSVQCVSSDELQ